MSTIVFSTKIEMTRANLLWLSRVNFLNDLTLTNIGGSYEYKQEYGRAFKLCVYNKNIENK